MEAERFKKMAEKHGVKERKKLTKSDILGGMTSISAALSSITQLTDASIKAVQLVRKIKGD